jgi:hypothetical protein
MNMRKRQENELWNLRALRDLAHRDNGTPLTAGELAELDQFITDMETRLA